MTDKYSKERRGFLKTLALFGGAAVFTAGAKGSGSSAKPSPAVPEKTGAAGGYRETEHIRKYYQTIL
jgi:nitrous oxide reductase